MCRGAVGWTRLDQERIEEARAAFRSMEALYAGGLRAELPGLVGSGIEGLDRVGRELFERDRIEDAAAVYQTLHAYEPDVLAWALRAGRYHRDAGARMLVQAEAARRRSSNPERDVERSNELLGLASVPRPADGDEPGWQAALARVDVQLSKRAAESFEDSYAAFRAAAELAPEDVAVLTEAAELPIQYLHRDPGEPDPEPQDAGPPDEADLEWARATLERCIELGRTQLEDPALDEDRQLALREAWGDAHQDLGVLALEHDGDREAARRWFEQSLAIGPYPRPIVKDDYLPRCAARGPDETPR
jgi:tetratricopeptide (TPR) repeat protein